jgi:hypothetical protein
MQVAHHGSNTQHAAHGTPHVTDHELQPSHQETKNGRPEYSKSKTRDTKNYGTKPPRPYNQIPNSPRTEALHIGTLEYALDLNRLNP